MSQPTDADLNALDITPAERSHPQRLQHGCDPLPVVDLARDAALVAPVRAAAPDARRLPGGQCLSRSFPAAGLPHRAIHLRLQGAWIASQRNRRWTRRPSWL